MASLTGDVIVSQADEYQGCPYKWGGAMPTGWDCSGFVNWVLGHDLGMTLPGGVTGFTGSSHGPPSGMYLAWKGAQTVKGTPAPGDLCIWPDHIGFAVNSTTLISALNPRLGTAIGPIAGAALGPVAYRRIIAAGDPTDPASGAGAATGAGCPATLLMLPALPVLAITAGIRRNRANRRATT